MDGNRWAPPGGTVGGDAPPRSRGWMIIAGLAGLLVALVIAGLLLAGGDGERDDEDDRASAAGRETETSSRTATTRPATTTTAPAWRDVTSADGAFHVRLPPTWDSITVDGDMTGGGTEMFAGDPVRAVLADQVLSILVTPQTRFVAMDGEAPAYVEDTAMLLVENGPSNVGQEAAFEAAQRYIEGTVRQEGTIRAPVGEIGWFEFEPAGVQGMLARDYVVVNDGTAWRLTFWSGHMDHQRALADEIVGSFSVG